MTHGISRCDPDFEGPDTETDEIIDTRLRALQKEFDETAPGFYDDYREYAGMNPHDEEFRTELEKENDFA